MAQGISKSPSKLSKTGKAKTIMRFKSGFANSPFVGTNPVLSDCRLVVIYVHHHWYARSDWLRGVFGCVQYVFYNN